MIFITLALLAVILYVWDHKILALLVFFFFITTGFNLIPNEMIQFAFITKSADYAFYIFFGIILIDAICLKKYLKRDNFTLYLYLFFAFLVGCMLYSKIVVDLTWTEIIRTCRYQFFWIVYFVFRNMEQKQLEKLLKYLFNITVFTSFLFILQIVIDRPILNKTAISSTNIFGMTFPRFYNQPDMLHYFALLSIFCNPYKGIKKQLTLVILVAALMGAFHRSLTGVFILSIAVGFVLRLSRLRRIQIVTLITVIGFFIISFVGYKFVTSRTYSDLKVVMSGNIADADISLEDLGNATFAFRMAHFLERNQYLLDHPKTLIFGAGLIPEDSKKVDKFFDFKVGLIAELTGNVVQLDTGDISYSVLFLRFGYIGTVLNLLLFACLIIFFYKKRKNKYAFASFLYYILAFGVSFFSANLVQPMAFLLPLIGYFIIKKTEEQEVIESKSKNVPIQ
jgi:hypothetical protein